MAEDRFTAAEWKLLESARTRGMTLREQERFVQAVDDLVLKRRTVGYTERQEEAALEKVEKLLIGDAAMALAIKDREWPKGCRGNHKVSAWRTKEQ